MCVGKITSIRTTVLETAAPYSLRGQCGCFGCDMDVAKSKPKGGMDAANIASTRRTCPKGTFSTVSDAPV